MRTVALTMFILSIFLVPVGALSSTLEPEYSPGETMIARIEGTFISPLQSEQIELRRGHVLVALEHDVAQLDTTTYFWGVAPLIPENYTLFIKDIQIMQEGSARVVNYSHNFSVRGEIAPYAIQPGFVNTVDDFSVIITSYKDSDQTIAISHPLSREIVLAPGKTTHFVPAASIPANTLTSISIGIYRAPVFIRGNGSTTLGGEQISIWVVDPPRLYAKIRTDEPLPSYIVTAEYLGNQDLKNVAVRYNSSVLSVNPSSFKSIKINESLTLNVSIKQHMNISRTDEL